MIESKVHSVFLEIRYIDLANQPITMPIKIIMKISRDRGKETSQNSSWISTIAAFCTANMITIRNRKTVIENLYAIVRPR